MRSTPAPLEAERAVLGSIMTRPERLPDVLEVLQPDSFYRPEHGALLQLMITRTRDGRDIGLIGLPEAVAQSGRQDAFGGVGYVLGLCDAAPSVLALPAWCEEVREASVRRRILALAEGLPEAAAHGDPEALIRELGAAAGMLRGARRESRDLHGGLSDLIETMGRESTGDAPGAMSTGLEGLDEILSGGLRRGGFTVLAGRPSMGKTAVGLSIALAVVRGGGVAGVVSMEMQEDPLLRRVLANLASVPLDHIVQPEMLDQREWDRIVEARDRVQAMPLYLIDQPRLTAQQIAAQARAWALRGLDLLVIDHLSEMQHPRMDRHDLAVGESAAILRELGSALGCHVLLLQQLNRDCEKRDNKRPRRSDLRDSGTIEQMADNIIFTYRDAYYNPENPAGGANGMELIVAKQRMGRTATASAHWRGSYQQVSDDPGLREVVGE